VPSLVTILEATLRGGGIASLAVARDGKIFHATEGFFALTGLSREGARRETLEEIIGELRATGRTAAEIADVFAKDDLTGGDLALSDERILETRLHHLDEGVRVWTFRDVTIERRTTRALDDAENWLRMFAAHANGVVLELDGRARVVGLWSQGTSLTDTGRAELHDRTLTEIFGPAEGALFEERLREVLATGRPASFEYVADRVGGQRVFAANAVPLPAEGRAGEAVTVLIRDVTERARLQQQLLQGERLASLGLFAAGVAHEVNNPLAYMLLNVQHVLRGLGELSTRHEGKELGHALADFESCLGIAVEGAQRVQEIVKDLRRFSRGDDLEPLRVVDVHDVLRFTLAMIENEIGKRARLVRDFGPLPKVLAGEGRLNQVFLNLIINAIQAIDDRNGADHEIRLVTVTDTNGNAVVEVHDTGSGIREEHLPKIFDPFFTTKAAGVGTGLGLAICHGITTSLGGSMTVESKVAVGSTFRVVLPPTSVPDAKVASFRTP
jgi:signal transduction histidine kinase